MEDLFSRELELGALRPPTSYLYTASPPKERRSAAPPKARPRPGRRSSRSQLTELSSREAEELEAQLGVAPEALPPHLRAYALQRRSAASFSGPGLLPGEVEAGRVEYKLRLGDPAPARFQQLVTQLNWRLSEGAGECLYALGVEDNGHPAGLPPAELDASLAVLARMAAEVGARAEVLQMPPGTGDGLRCAVVRVRRAPRPPPAAAYADLRVAVAGGVDSGKSTLVGVLCHGAGGAPALDSGRGSARTPVLRHKHEVASGHTSSISVQQCAYDRQGAVLNYSSSLSGLPPGELAGAAASVVRFFDLGGHERFTKTALHGLTTLLPDAVLLCVSAAAGVSWVTHEHLAVALALGIPLAVAVTKTDVAGETGVAAVAAEIRELLAAAVQQSGAPAPGAPASLAPLVRSAQQAAAMAAAAHRSRVAAPGATLCVPLFGVSSVSGAGLDLLHRYLSALQPAGCGGGGAPPVDAGGEGMQGWGQAAGPASGPEGGSAHFQIDASFEVADVGTVYSGTVVAGHIAVGDELLLGPLEGGGFSRVAVSGIHRSKVDVPAVARGQHATLAVRQLEDAPAARAGVGAGDACGQRQQRQQQQQPEPLPARADSASCLHAWMQQTCGGPGEQGRAGLLPSSAAVAIQGRHGAGVVTSQSAAQLGDPQPLGGSSADHLHHGWASSPQLAPAGSGPAPRPRKGAVLLDPCLRPQACSQFEAVLVLLGGHWPARGLLSGCYPPEGEPDEPDPQLLRPHSGGGSGAASDSGDGLAAGSFGGRAHSLGSCKLRRCGSRRRGGAYIPVVHCGSIRQAAQVLTMRELPRSAAAAAAAAAGAGSDDDEDPFAALLDGDVQQLAAEPSDGSRSGAACGSQQLDARRLAGAVAAAGVLLPPAAGGSSGGGFSGGEGGSPGAVERRRSQAACDDIGCLAAVTLRFMHQPEWLVEGARLIARDRSTGRVAAAGYVARLLPGGVANEP